MEKTLIQYISTLFLLLCPSVSNHPPPPPPYLLAEGRSPEDRTAHLNRSPEIILLKTTDGERITTDGGGKEGKREERNAKKALPAPYQGRSPPSSAGSISDLARQTTEL